MNMNKLCKKFYVEKYNCEILQLERSLIILNDLLRRFAEVGVGITTEFCKQLLDSPREVFNKYLDEEPLRKYWYGGCKLPRSERGKARCKMVISRLICNNTGAMVRYSLVDSYLTDAFETLFTIKDGIAIKTENAELHIMHKCMEFITRHEEGDIDGICRQLEKAVEEEKRNESL